LPVRRALVPDQPVLPVLQVQLVLLVLNLVLQAQLAVVGCLDP
jgi:hypothetical protein